MHNSWLAWRLVGATLSSPAPRQALRLVTWDGTR